MGTSVGTAGASPAFSFSQHGPFFRLQRRVGLLSETDPGIARRVALFTLIAWLPIALLAALQGYALNEHHGRAVLLDFSAYAFLIAVAAFVLMERTSDQRMAWLIAQFSARGIVPEASRECLRQARQMVERRTGSPLAEGVILIGAYWFAFVWMQRGAARVEGGTWFGQIVNGDLQFTLAGW